MPNITFDLKEINGGGAKADEFLEENRRTDHASVPLPQVGEVELEIPPFFITPTKKGWRLVNPLTAVRNLATRRGETAISLARKNVEEPKLNEKEPHPHPQLSSFSVSDRKRIIAYYEAVKRGEHTKYTTKNKPRGFPATLYKNARRAGLTEDPNTKTYRKNATIAKPKAKPKAKPPPSPPPSLSNKSSAKSTSTKSSAKSNSTRSLSVSPLPSLPSLARSSSARARSSSESSIESEVSSASSASSKDEKIMETAEQYDFEDIVNILNENRVDYKIGKRNPDKYFHAGVIGYFPKELYDFDTDMELVLFLNNLQNAVREVIDHIIKNPDKPIDPDYHFTNSWVNLAWESNNHKIPVQLQRYTQHFLTEIGAYKYDDDEDRLIPLKAIKKAIAKFKIVPKEDEDRGTVVINRKGKGLKSESDSESESDRDSDDNGSDSDQDKNGGGLFDKIKSFVKPKSKEEKAKKNPAQTLEDSELKDLLNKSYESGLSDYGDYKVDRDLSNPITQVYYHSAKKQPVVVHRGSQDAQDWLENLQYGLNDKSGSHFKKAEETQRKAEEKYGTENLTTIGHSKGSIHAEKFGKRGKQIITLNKPVNVNDLFSKVPENQIDIKTSGDPVSVLRGLQQGNPARVLESKTSNPLLEHQISNLEGLGFREDFLNFIRGNNSVTDIDAVTPQQEREIQRAVRELNRRPHHARITEMEIEPIRERFRNQNRQNRLLLEERQREQRRLAESVPFEERERRLMGRADIEAQDREDNEQELENDRILEEQQNRYRNRAEELRMYQPSSNHRSSSFSSSTPTPQHTPRYGYFGRGLPQSDPCWKGYKQLGMKTKNGKEVPNCVPQSNRIDFDDMKWGSFTNQFKRFRQTNPHSNIKDLHGFANMIVTHPKHFSHTTFRRASFYLNVLLHKK